MNSPFSGTNQTLPDITLISASVSDRGLSEKRPENEDSYLELPARGIFAVADGVGGAQAGEVASQMAVEILGEAFTNLPEGADAESAMRAAFEKANSSIYQMSRELPQLASMATTVVALHLAGNIATIGHVGDSRLYRLDDMGELVRDTQDHSMVADEVRAGRMTEEQAESHPSRNIISRALGADSIVEPELKTIMVEPGTSFLLCSDGITRHVTDVEIRGALAYATDPARTCEHLKELCYQRGAEDNLTAVIVMIGGQTQNPSFVPNFTDEFATTQTARTEKTAPSLDEFGDDDLLELDTAELPTIGETPAPPVVEDEPVPESLIETQPLLDLEETIPDNHAFETVPNDVVEGSFEETIRTPVAINETAQPQVATREDNFKIFGSEELSTESDTERSSIAKTVTTAAIFVLGTLIGLGVYHFALLPTPVETQTPQLNVMRSEDIALTSFEKNRRNVDFDPAAYLKEVPPAEDAEDFYLIGRANLLIGDYPKARLALIEAQKLLSSVDPSNARVLKTDIAAALVIVNDVSVQNRLKTELAPTTQPANSINTNANSLPTR